MPLSANDQASIRKFLQSDISSLLNSMTEYVDQDTKRESNELAIMYVAQLRGISYDVMEGYVNDPKRESIYGGEVANEYFRLLRLKVEEIINNEKELLKQAVCINFKYCEKRKSGVFQNEEYSLAIALADSFLTYLTGFPLPVATLAVYCIKKGILDDWCGC